ncbi:transposase [Roseomonas sp. M0104]|uniref:Transposase n=1 Tax=Teichococcus coralli TaxID=2545983 RepID=A0A845BLX6_9PROT|nr:IS3 family transposase [Pseudoroseomonas coralli]MXP66142.1 transposase [Pseudoroseomonas coralli]
MELSRSTFYDTAPVPLEEESLLARIGAICDEFEGYGYRRVGAALRHQGVVVNDKKLRRLMRQRDLQPKRRRRYVARQTATMADRSTLTWSRTSFPTARTSCGSRT